MKKNITFIGFIFVLIIGILSACSSSSSTSGEATKGGGKDKAEITVGVEAGGVYSEFYKGLSKDFTKETGIKVNFIDVPHDNMHQRFLTEAMSGSGAIDVYQTDQPWISEFASNGFLEPLSDRLSKEDKADFFPDALNTVKYKDKIYGLPYLVHTPVVYYRTDLFEKAGLKEAPKTWDEYREYAKKLNDPAAGVSGTLVEGKQSGEPVTHLLDLIHQSGGGVLDGNKVIIDSPEVKNVFNYLLAIQHEDKTSPEGAVGYDNADAHNMFMQGKVAMIKNWPYMYSLANDPSSSKVAGKFAVAVQPKGQNGGSAVWSWGFGISSDSKQKDAAWKFVKWATSTENVQKLGKQFINPVPRNSALEEIKKDTSLKAEDLKAITVMSEAIQGGESFTENTKFPAIQERLSVTLSKILSKQSNVDDALKDTAKDIKKILEE